MNFPTRLKELRKSKKVNQTEVGQIAGITSKQIQRYESGESEPTLSVLQKLADYFDVSIDYLTGKAERDAGPTEETTTITCPICKNKDCDEKDTFCFNCGAYLKNYCTNDHCILNSGDERAELPAYMCFCPECGEETYYKKEGLISPRVFEDE